jgi:hypothetical protein
MPSKPKALSLGSEAEIERAWPQLSPATRAEVQRILNREAARILAERLAR